MSDWNNWLVFDILGDMCFGRSFDIKEPKPNPIRIVPNLVISHVQMVYPILQSPFMKFYVWAKPRGLNYLFNMMAPEEIRAYYKFINDSDPVTGEGYSEVALRGEAVLLIVAGSDTTSSTLSGFWFYISRNVNAYQRLTSEIRSTFKLCDEIKIGSKLSSCTYLYACIDEALRITPSGPSDFPREVLSGGTNIDGEYFPEGTIVGCSHWSMSRNEHIYGDPNRFRPERYIPSEATGVTVEQVNELKSYYQPFLIGPTNCAGKNIAMTELAIIIAKTLFALDLRSVPGEDLGAGHPSQGWGKRDKNQYQIVDVYITVHEGPMVQFRKRSV
ncbi:cytochrome P450 [Corynespora cassiicola Philippines]|uniref:Cytochrome P450 n=1 Tax=Corynespora cassiicola Philippines TaxID=1448308 RepID=A0A2T2NZS5_CORCC|nr:cytochrome P450 [Corynespora cassiicola Philippines]